MPLPISEWVNQEALGKGMTPQPPNARMMQYYAQQYPFLAEQLKSPQALMDFITTIHKRESSNQPGTAPNLFEAQKAQSALGEIYGVNNYTPQGFMEWNPDLGQWVNPRAPAQSVVNDKR